MKPVDKLSIDELRALASITADARNWNALERGGVYAPRGRFGRMYP